MHSEHSGDTRRDVAGKAPQVGIRVTLVALLGQRNDGEPTAGQHRGHDQERTNYHARRERPQDHGRRNTNPTPRTVSTNRGAPTASSLRRR